MRNKKALHTRITPDAIGYDGINLYDENKNFIGDIIWKVTESGKVKVAASVDGVTIVPKAVDKRDDDLYYFDDEDIIE